MAGRTSRGGGRPAPPTRLLLVGRHVLQRALKVVVHLHALLLLLVVAALLALLLLLLLLRALLLRAQQLVLVVQLQAGGAPQAGGQG